MLLSLVAPRSAGDGARHAQRVVVGVQRSIREGFAHDEGVHHCRWLSREIRQVELHPAVVALADAEVSENGVTRLLSQKTVFHILVKDEVGEEGGL